MGAPKLLPLSNAHRRNRKGEEKRGAYRTLVTNGHLRQHQSIQTVIFDIDGTPADIAHRRPYLDSEHPNWTRFNAAMVEDTINLAAVELYRTLWESKVFRMEFVTAK
jgi:hypothetical protein